MTKPTGGTPPPWHRRATEDITVSGQPTGRHRAALEVPKTGPKRFNRKPPAQRKHAATEDARANRPAGAWMRTAKVGPPRRRGRGYLEPFVPSPAQEAPPKRLLPPVSEGDAPVRAKFMFVDVVIASGPKWQRPAGEMESRPVPRRKHRSHRLKRKTLPNH